jgi:hypothetical protein
MRPAGPGTGWLGGVVLRGCKPRTFELPIGRKVPEPVLSPVRSSGSVWAVLRACLLACRLAEEPQHPIWPHRAQCGRCNHQPSVAKHSTHRSFPSRRDRSEPQRGLVRRPLPGRRMECRHVRARITSLDDLTQLSQARWLPPAASPSYEADSYLVRGDRGSSLMVDDTRVGAGRATGSADCRAMVRPAPARQSWSRTTCRPRASSGLMNACTCAPVGGIAHLYAVPPGARQLLTWPAIVRNTVVTDRSSPMTSLVAAVLDATAA